MFRHAMHFKDLTTFKYAIDLHKCGIGHDRSQLHFLGSLSMGFTVVSPMRTIDV